MFTLMVILGMIGIILVLCFIALIINWISTVQSYSTKMSYNEFKVRYGLDPRYWTLRDGYVEFSFKNKEHCIRFGFLDYLRYELFASQIGRREEKKRQINRRKKLNETFKEFDEFKERTRDDV